MIPATSPAKHPPDPETASGVGEGEPKRVLGLRHRAGSTDAGATELLVNCRSEVRTMAPGGG